MKDLRIHAIRQREQAFGFDPEILDHRSHLARARESRDRLAAANRRITCRDTRESRATIRTSRTHCRCHKWDEILSGLQPVRNRRHSAHAGCPASALVWPGASVEDREDKQLGRAHSRPAQSSFTVTPGMSALVSESTVTLWLRFGKMNEPERWVFSGCWRHWRKVADIRMTHHFRGAASDGIAQAAKSGRNRDVRPRVQAGSGRQAYKDCGQWPDRGGLVCCDRPPTDRSYGWRYGRASGSLPVARRSALPRAARRDSQPKAPVLDYAALPGFVEQAGIDKDGSFHYRRGRRDEATEQ